MCLCLDCADKCGKVRKIRWKRWRMSGAVVAPIMACTDTYLSTHLGGSIMKVHERNQTQRISNPTNPSFSTHLQLQLYLFKSTCTYTFNFPSNFCTREGRGVWGHVGPPDSLRVPLVFFCWLPCWMEPARRRCRAWCECVCPGLPG